MAVDDDSRITFLKKELGASLQRINCLEKENQELRQEAASLRAQLSALKAYDVERRTMLWKKFQNSMDSKIEDKSPEKSAPIVEFPGRSPTSEKLNPKDLAEHTAKKERSSRLLKSPPRNSPPGGEINQTKLVPAPALAQPPPPPPPPPPKKLLGGAKGIRRVPEVMEFYRSLMKRDTQKESKTNTIGGTAVVNPKNMIGEIENRSAYLLAIKSDVEVHGGTIRFLSREVETAAFSEISEVESFVKWLDGQLACLVDERAVLKHFPQWPERKADALREAACNYRSLKNLEAEVASFKDNPKQPAFQSLRKIQALQERLEQSVDNIERLREITSKRYKEFHIPWAWMLDTGVTGKLKLISLTLGKQYMKRIAKEVQCTESSSEGLLLQGVRFANRIHQFAGGFDAETMRAFEELRKTGTNYQFQ